VESNQNVESKRKRAGAESLKSTLDLTGRLPSPEPLCVESKNFVKLMQTMNLLATIRPNRP